MPKHASSHLKTIAVLTALAVAIPSYAFAGEEIQGTIASINSTFNISVDDGRGFMDNVELHQGTSCGEAHLELVCFQGQFGDDAPVQIGGAVTPATMLSRSPWDGSRPRTRPRETRATSAAP